MDTSTADDWDAALAAIVSDGPLDEPWAEPWIEPGADATVSHLLDGRPGVDLARTLARLTPARLDPADAVAYARATERLIAWAHLLQAQALVAIAGPRPQTQVHEVDDAVITIEDAARSEVAAALRWPEPTAHDRITTARLICGPMLLTRSALESGEITYRHAEAISATVQRVSSFTGWLDPDQDDRRFRASCRELEEDVLPVARSRDVASTRRRGERALHRLDAAHAEKRRQQARSMRDVWVQAEPDGMALLCARLGIAEARACLSVVDRMAQRQPAADGGSDLPLGHPPVGQRRADALTSLLLADTPDVSSVAVQPTVRTHVDVVIDLPTLLGLDDEPASLRGGGPGGPVPVSAQVVRDLVLADETATMRRLVTDPMTGHLLDRGRSTYAIPESLRTFIQSRDGTCRFPGCHRRADLGQVDHAQPWQDGGMTDRRNLGILCIRHHQLKTFGGWTITRSGEDGSATWRSPAGITYEHPPPRLLSDE